MNLEESWLANIFLHVIWFNYALESLAHHGIWKQANISYDSRYGQPAMGVNNYDISNFQIGLETANSITPITNHYIRTRTGRHVCSRHHGNSPAATEVAASEPVKMLQTQLVPVYKTYSEVCEGNKLCQAVRVEYQTTYKENYQHQPSSIHSFEQQQQQQQQLASAATPAVFQCCPGWYPKGASNYGCNRALCENSCANGGTCISPGLCVCRPGFTGKYCDEDINECSHPSMNKCDQICVNKFGNYQCDCVNNFILLPDGHTCKNVNIGNGVATEVKDLERDTIRNKNLSSAINTILRESRDEQLFNLDQKTVLLLRSKVDNLQKKLDETNRAQKDQLNLLEQKFSTLRKDYENKIDVLTKRMDSCCKPEKIKTNTSNTKEPTDFDYWFSERLH